MHDWIDAAILAASHFDLAFVLRLLAASVLIAGIVIWRLYVCSPDIEFERECRDEEFDRAIRGFGRMGE